MGWQPVYGNSIRILISIKGGELKCKETHFRSTEFHFYLAVGGALAEKEDEGQLN